MAEIPRHGWAVVEGVPRRLRGPALIRHAPRSQSTEPTDTDPPVVANFDPEPGTALARDSEISFEVTDNAGLAAVLVAADFGFSGTREVVFDATGFAARYAGSTREEIPGGFRFRIARVGGWPEGGGPTLLIDAVDTAGNRPVLLGQGPTMTLDFGATHRRAW